MIHQTYGDEAQSYIILSSAYIAIGSVLALPGYTNASWPAFRKVRLRGRQDILGLLPSAAVLLPPQPHRCPPRTS